MYEDMINGMEISTRIWEPVTGKSGMQQQDNSSNEYSVRFLATREVFNSCQFLRRSKDERTPCKVVTVRVTVLVRVTRFPTDQVVLLYLFD
jgi:hypothetical protein